MIARLEAEISGQDFSQENSKIDARGLLGDEIQLFEIRKQQLESSIEI